MQFRFSSKVHYSIAVLSLVLLAVGMPFNKILMSLGSMLGVFNLLLERDFKEYWNNIKKNKAFLWLFIFIGIHLLGLLWTDDYSYAFHDLQIKLPLLAVPLALVARPIEKTHLYLILKILLVTLTFSSIINFGSYFNWFGDKVYLDIREMSLFGSHIRYGILVGLGVGICIHLIEQTKKYQVLLVLLIIWFSIYTFYSQVISGGITLLIVFIFYLFKWSWNKNRVLTYSLAGVFSILFISLIGFFRPQSSILLDPDKLPKFTNEGNHYDNDLMSKHIEHNQPVYVSFCDKELRREWNKLSVINYDSLDLKQQFIRNTLIRYLSSKKLSKDAEGIKHLSSEDISNIEKGIASIDELKSGLIGRLYAVRFQLNNNEDPNGHSLLQRFEYWKTTVHIIQENWLIGVGTGDVQSAFDKQYEKEKSPLKIQNRLRAHNLYLTILVTFGVVGCIVFLLFLYQFLKFNFTKESFLSIVFLAVFMVTSLIEDTIETQLGVCIVAFFIAIGLQKDK
jgi:hypothetical protein